MLYTLFKLMNETRAVRPLRVRGCHYQYGATRLSFFI